jgi:hypothetical protein
MENGFNAKSFEMQCAIYRDYNQGIDGILEFSSWNSDPLPLRDFLSKVQAKGGDDYEEAIEIGLQHSLKEHQKEPISSIILIANATAKKKDAVKILREKYGGEDLW